MGNLRNRGCKSARKVLTMEEDEEKEREESRNHRHSINEKILSIPTQHVKKKNSIENTMLDTLEKESKQRNLIVENTIHSLVNQILVSNSLDGTLHFASNTCTSTSRGKS